jgi:hypothetical protein
MPTRVPKQGSRRSGQGVAPGPLGKPIVKNFDPPRYPFYQGAGGTPSSAADTTWSQYGQTPFGKDDVMAGPMGQEEELLDKVVESLIHHLLELNTVAAGGITGYTLPLGAANPKKRPKRKKKKRV